MTEANTFRTLQGRVVSDKMDKSIVVAIEASGENTLSMVSTSSVLPKYTLMTRAILVAKAI